MATTLTTEHSYTGNGSTTNYSVTFPYLKKADVKVTLDHVATTAYTFANASTISFTTAPANGVGIRIFRDTDVDAARFVFSSGSALKAGELNENLDQLLYADQERASTDNIADQAVTTAKLRDEAVTAAKLGPSAIITAKIADGSVTTAKIAADAVNGTKIADDSINSEHYVDGSIDTAHIADAQVTTVKIADSAITETKLADNSVTSAKIVNGTIAAVDLATNSVTASKIASNAVVEAKILNGAVTTNKVSDGAITSGKIANDTIVNADVNPSAAIAGTKVSPDFGSQTIATTGSITVSGTVDGRDVSTDGTKLDGIESGATADQTAAEVRTLVGSATDSNVFTDAEKTKLTGISAGADVTSTKSINDLTDVNTAGVSDGKILKYQASSSSFIISDDTGGSTGATTFTGLTDTPANYGNAAGRVLYINAAGNAVEFNDNINIDSSGRLGIGTTSPDAFLHVETNGPTTTRISGSRGNDNDLLIGSIEFENYYNTQGVIAEIKAITGSSGTQSTKGQLAFYTDNGSNYGLAERLRIDSSGNLGLGTTSPTETLTLNTASGASIGFEYDGTEIATISNNNAALYVHAGSGKLLSLGADGGEKVRVLANGKVGIGTSSPAELLHLKSNTPYIRFEDDNDNQDWNIEARSFFGINDVTNNAFRFVIDGSGNIGLGTSSPVKQLHIHNSSATEAQIQLTDSGTGSTTSDGMRVGWNGTLGQIYVYENADLRFATNNSERMRIDSSGNLGLGTSSPSKRLHVSTSGSGIQEVQWLNNAQAVGANVGAALVFTGTTSNNGLARISGCFEGAATTNGGYIKFDTRAQTSGALTEAMRISSSGNVGIGTSSPSTKLHLNSTAGIATRIESTGTSGDTILNLKGNVNNWELTAPNSSSVYGFYIKDVANSRIPLFIDGSGKVGVNTASPANQFEVVSSGATKANFTHASSNKTSLYLESDDTSARIGSTYYGSGGSFKPLAFLTSGSERMRIDSSGRLLVGSTSVYVSDANFQVTDDTNAKLVISNPGNATYSLAVGTDNALAFKDESNATERMRIDIAGRLMLGTTTEGAANEADNLTIADTGDVGITLRSTNSGFNRIYFSDGTSGTSEYAGYLLYKHADNAMIFGTSSTERMSIDSSGNINATGEGLFQQRISSGRAAIGGTSVDYGITAYANRTSTGNTASVFAQNYNAAGRNFAGVNSSGTTTCSILANGNATFAGALSKGSGSFKISHPLPAKAETHHLVHSFIEGPQADLIYRGYVDLVDGQATVNIDTAGRMSEGTFEVLCTNVSCFTSNESDWIAVKGSVTGNVLTIAAQDATATSKVSWMVVGERKDQHMIDTDWTDAAGRVITEPEKVVEAVEETEE